MDSKITVNWQRSKAYPGTYLLSAYVRLDCIDSCAGAFLPQAHAVVDDFGNLVIVRGWM